MQFFSWNFDLNHFCRKGFAHFPADYLTCPLTNNQSHVVEGSAYPQGQCKGACAADPLGNYVSNIGTGNDFERTDGQTASGQVFGSAVCQSFRLQTVKVNKVLNMQYIASC